MNQDISGSIRNEYETIKGIPCDEFREHIKTMKVPTWEYVCWLESALYKLQMPMVPSFWADEEKK